MILFFLSSYLFAFTKVAVIDTGYNISNITFPLCKEGHVDLTHTSMNDTFNHGKIVSQLISDNAKNKHCQVIIKYLDNNIKQDNLEIFVMALYHVYRTIPDVDIVNISSSSGLSQYNSKDLDSYIKTGVMSTGLVLMGKNNLKNVLRERLLIKLLLNRGVKLIVAAGNSKEHINNNNCNIFPACHDSRIIVVGYSQSSSLKSNSGKFVDVYEKGYRIRTNQGEMTGSSAATAIHTGKLIGK